jgi:endonuclease/exonuclease/phosphatase family metal-dependent hydrolase
LQKKYIFAALASTLMCLTGAARASMEFNVGTYNLRLNTPDDGPNAWPLRRDAVRALIDYHQIDLLGTQEGLMDQIDDLAAMPGFAYVGVGRDDGKRAGEHSAIFYRTTRFALLAHGDFWLSETPTVPGKGWDATCCNRIASWAKLRERQSKREFYVFSVHFDHQGVIARRESAHLMLREMHDIAGDNPVLCLGDFNATPESEPISIMSAALRDSRTVSQTPPYGPVGTFNDFKIDAPLKERIDYIFLGPRWQVLSYAALTDTHEARFPSDHLPVVARLRLE